jgi:hypothetical protein
MIFDLEKVEQKLLAIGLHRSPKYLESPDIPDVIYRIFPALRLQAFILTLRFTLASRPAENILSAPCNFRLDLAWVGSSYVASVDFACVDLAASAS